MSKNEDLQTIEGFGDEWTRFDQRELPEDEKIEIFESYFSIFPWNSMPPGAEGFDLGCGSGRWATLVAPRVGKLHCIDPSAAIDIARKNLSSHKNCVFHRASVDSLPLEDRSMDFGYALGVLHHVPDTQLALITCGSKLKKGAPLLLYLYYSFENRPLWFRGIWLISNMIRKIVSRLPYSLRYFISQMLAFLIYLPFSYFSRLGELVGFNVESWPLSSYRNYSVYTMRTDALDRFGTRVEKRFAKADIERMMVRAGFERVQFSTNAPFWCALGIKT